MPHSRTTVVLLAPFEIVLCVAHGAWCGLVDGVGSVRDAWVQATALSYTHRIRPRSNPPSLPT